MNLNELLDSVNWGTLSFNTFEPKKIEPTNQYEDLLKRIKIFKSTINNPSTTLIETPAEELKTVEEVIPIIEQEPQEIRIRRINNSDNYQDFMYKLENYALQTSLDHDTMLKLEFLAGLESKYKQNVENYAGSKALGWFQFMDSTRHAYNKQSRKDFANDANAQFQAAIDHINFIDKAYISKWKKEIKDAGLNDFQALYGFWWNPSDMEKFLKDNNYNRVTKYNESIQKILKRAGYEKSNSNNRK